MTAIVTCDTGWVYAAGYSEFRGMRSKMCDDLLDQEAIHPARWQQLDVSQSDGHRTYELLNVTAWYDMPGSEELAVEVIGPDLPWAEGHFQERVQGFPTNPGVWHHRWPYHAGQVELHQRAGHRYDHNYMERFWASKLAVERGANILQQGYPFQGYRFAVGDLGHVVKQLQKDPSTRQAYLPMWFPEDTGARANQRVPCTLGYHFIIRDRKLHVFYPMRSCEIYRHFTNDVYMAVRLAQWVGDQLTDAVPGLQLGQLTMQIVSLHGFVADTDKIVEMAEWQPPVA